MLVEIVTDRPGHEAPGYAEDAQKEREKYATTDALLAGEGT